MRKPELLAPAGQPDAAYAAFAYGADAVYLGLPQFSARAEAVNFSAGDLAELTGYAHSLPQPRRVYLTLNTLIKQSELPAALRTLAAAALAGVDAVIVQDLGLARAAAALFPDLQLHASTQMAVHSLESALAAEDLGYKRVTLARELTLAEVAHIRDRCAIEIETFIHGTLCYSYSGLCLFSSILTGRSGNRGRCVYSCREAVRTPDGHVSHPFSLKDMALGPLVRDLARVGVDSLKIEGRKKSPLYVAATVDYYRRILDGETDPDALAEAEARLKTVFARPWTTLFFHQARNPDVADPEVVGHRGSPIGTIDGLCRTPAGPGIVFTPSMAVERHDGVQIDLPGASRPFGFGIDHLYAVSGKKFSSAFALPAGGPVAVALPDDAPAIPRGAPVYLSSSQAVKRSFPFTRPKPGAFRPRLALDAAAGLGPDGLFCTLTLALPAVMNAEALTLDVKLAAAVHPARDPAGSEAAARTAFTRLGAAPFRLNEWSFANPDTLYAKPGDWNALRREAVSRLETLYDQRVERFLAECAGLAADPAVPAVPAAARPEAAWILHVHRPEDVATFTAEDWRGCAEAIVDIPPCPDAAFEQALTTLAAAVDTVRLAAPVIVREDFSGAVYAAITRLAAAGWKRWLVPSLGVWRTLAGMPGVAMAADWPLYAMNRQALARLGEMGFSACTLSPEDEAGNLRELLGRALETRIVVYAELPLFIAAACAHAHLGCCRRDHSGCGARETGLDVAFEKSGDAAIWPQECGSVVTLKQPFSLIDRIADLATMGGRRYVVDLRWRPYGADDVRTIWRRCRAGGRGPGTAGNFSRGLV